MSNLRISPSAIVETSAIVGAGTSIWHNTQIRNDAVIGEDCIIGKDVYVGSTVRIGNCCKIQNGAQLYEPAILGNGVFIGPQVILTNDRTPRAINPDGTLKSAHDWKAVGVTIDDGASIGANSTCIAPIRIGKWAMVGGSSVVIQDVPNYALVVGNPAKQIGWVNALGERLIPQGENLFRCPSSNAIYSIVDGEPRIQNL